MKPQLSMIWTSKLPITSDGSSYLEIVPVTGNQGNFILNLGGDRREDDRYFPRYFWDRTDAQREAEAYLIRQAIDVRGKSFGQSPRAIIQFGESLNEIVGDYCTATIQPILLFGGQRCAVGNYAAIVHVHEGKEDVFVADDLDLLPRLYFELAIAMTETWSWMRAREQV